jgi:hypothetical protein
MSRVVKRCACLALASALASSCASSPAPTAPSIALSTQPASGRYRLDIPPGWVRLPGRESEQQADLYLERDSGRSWVVARSTSGSAIRLGDLVAYRREQLFGGNPISEYREKRSYLGHGHHVPVSVSRFRSGPEIVLVMIAVDGDIAVELIGSVPAESDERAVLALLDGLRFAERQAP